MKVLVNDGIEDMGIKIMQDAGIQVDTNPVPQEKLADVLPEYDGICVRSLTKVRKDLIDVCPKLKVIGRGGVGMDNIDVAYAKSKGITVVNTPEASSRSVAELVFAHALSVSRFLHKAHQEMPVQGAEKFSALKKNYSKGLEMTGKTMGIIGFGRIGQELASLALGFGMHVKAYDPYVQEAVISIGDKSLACKVTIKTDELDNVLGESDYLSLHIPGLQEPFLNAGTFNKLKTGVILLNASRGESIDEAALLQNLDNGRVAYAGLDVFAHEPTPDNTLLNHPRVSTTPHIGASTVEAQNKIGIELAEKIVAALVKKNG